MHAVDRHARLRRVCHVDGQGRRAAGRLSGIARKTVAKFPKHPKHPVPPGCRRAKPPVRPKRAPFIPVIDRSPEDDRSPSTKQRHRAQRIVERLRGGRGFAGGIAIVTDHVREGRRRSRAVFVPLSHPPGRARVDFGEAPGAIGGVRRKLPDFAMARPHPDAFVIEAYPAGTIEARLATAMSRPSPSSAACRSRSCSTRPPLPLRRSSATGPASGPPPTRNGSRTPCLRTGSAGRARGMRAPSAAPSVRGRWRTALVKAWSASGVGPSRVAHARHAVVIGAVVIGAGTGGIARHGHLPRQGRHDLRSAARPAASGEEDRRPRSGSAAAGVRPAGRVRQAAPVA